MLKELTAQQALEWQIYDKLDPVGDWREDFRMGKQASVITNLFRAVYGDKDAKVEMTAPKDFMPDWGRQRVKKMKKQTVAEQKSILMNMVNFFKKGNVKEKRK